MDLANCLVDKFQYDNKDPIESFDRHIILAIISETIGRGHAEITQKGQLRYLLDYLSSKDIDAKTMVTETGYIDKHYLEDYSAYYSRCFGDHEKTCTRIHFFSKEFEEHTFFGAISNNNSAFIRELQDTYLGYCVIRPIPDTFLGKICLRPYKTYFGKNDTLYGKNGTRNTIYPYRIITVRNTVHLCGIELTVHTTPMCEQDKVVSACATSAVWSALKGYGHLSDSYMPSLSKITKVASELDLHGTRMFPTDSLKPAQIAKALKEFGLEPLMVGLEKQSIDERQRTIRVVANAYVGAGIPVLLGGEIYEKKKNGQYKLLGDHFVTMLGYKKSTSKKPQAKKRFSEDSEKIDRCYIHDDRYGQYLRLDIDKPREWKKGNKGTVTSGFPMSKYREPDEVLVPTIMIVGAYHKIRLRFWEIRGICNAIYDYFDQLKQDVKNQETISFDLPEDAKAYAKAVEIFLSGTWNIQLVEGSKYREEIRKTKRFFSSSMASNKADLCISNLPKYIWRCKILKNNTNRINCDLLFDATEISQGNVFLGYVAYDNQMEFAWSILSVTANNLSLSSKICCKLQTLSQVDIRSVLQRLRARHSKEDQLFGKPRTPRRNLKEGEQDAYNNIKAQIGAVKIAPPYDSVWDFINKDETTGSGYIWVIDKHGDLVIGKDIKERPKKDDKVKTNYRFEGHPTLANYESARVGGELYHGHKDRKKKKGEIAWWINTKSGTYGMHLSWDEEAQKDVLTNVLTSKFIGFSDVHDSIKISTSLP